VTSQGLKLLLTTDALLAQYSDLVQLV